MPRIITPQPDLKSPCQATAPIKTISGDTTDIKLALLETKVVPRDLINNFDTSAITQSTYLFVDNNGVAGKILALDLLAKEITWDLLSIDVKQKILEGLAKQNKLIAGDHILLTEDNKISVSLTAEDIGAITENEALTFITEQVALKVSTIPDEIATKIMIEVNKNLTTFREEVNQALYVSKQEIIQMTDARMDTKLANIEEIIKNNIKEALVTFDIDGGLVRTGD